MKIKNFLRSNILTITGAVLGMITAYSYWAFKGCEDGSCAITSNPLNSSLYGAIVGALVFSSFKKEDYAKK